MTHFHIQKHQVQLPGVFFQPAQQPQPGGKFKELSRLTQLVQGLFHPAPKPEPGVLTVIADGNSQHGAPPKFTANIVPQGAASVKPKMTAKAPNFPSGSFLPPNFTAAAPEMTGAFALGDGLVYAQGRKGA